MTARDARLSVPDYLQYAIAIGLGALIALYPAWQGALLAAGAMVAALPLCVRWPEACLAAMLVIGSFKGGIPGPIDATVVVTLTVLAVCVRDVSRRGLPDIRGGVWAWLALVFLVLVGSMYSPAPGYGWSKALRLALLGSAAVGGTVILVREDREVERFAQAIVILALIASGVGLLMGGDPTTYGRYTSLGATTIALGRVAAMGLGFALLFLFHWKRGRWPLAIVILVLAAALAGTGSRGPVIGLVASVVVVSATRVSLRGVVRLVVSALPVVAGAWWTGVWNAVPAASRARYASLLAGGILVQVTDRARAMSTAWRLFLRNPLTGIGTGGFSMFDPLRYPHNMALEVACENGLVALVVLVVMAVSGVRTAWVRAVKGGSLASHLVLMVLVMALANGAVSGDLNDNRLVFAGFAMAALRAVPMNMGSVSRVSSHDRWLTGRLK